MRVKRAVLLLVAAVCLLPQTAQAHLVPLIDISKLTEDASLIVVGEALSVSEGENGSFEIDGQLTKARKVVVVLRVVRILKGRALNEISFRSYSVLHDLSESTVRVNDFGMFFLRERADRIESVSLYHPSILAALAGCRSRGLAIERVVAEIECILKSPITTRRDMVTAIQYLRTAPAVNAIPALKAASATLPSPIDVLAGYILLHHNDLSLLPLIEKSLEESSKLAVEAEGSRSEFVLSDALTYIKDPAAIPSLSRLMSSTDAQTRRDAAGALRNIGTEAVIADLSKALYDEDWEVRWKAVMGLAGVAGSEDDDESWYPSHDAFKENEELYLDHWRKWARKKGIELKSSDRL